MYVYICIYIYQSLFLSQTHSLSLDAGGAAAARRVAARRLSHGGSRQDAVLSLSLYIYVYMYIYIYIYMYIYI